MDLKFKLETFEGPLDLLLHLIEKNKVNIYDIPIVEITAQYMDYIREMQRQDLNIMSEFMLMAATLLDIKARMLLPADEEDEEEEDPRAELVQQLLQYKMYKYMSYELKDKQIEARKKLYKEPTIPEEVLAYREPVDMDKLTEGLDLTKLNEIFQAVMKRQSEKVDPIRSSFGHIEQEEISLDDKLISLESYARKHKKFSFRNMLEKQKSRMEIVVTFLAILEMMKSGKITIMQSHLFDEIFIESSIAA